jgi:hypothetical protein
VWQSDRGAGVKALLRIILNAVTMLSLMLCLAMVMLWVRSYRHFDYAFHNPSTSDALGVCFRKGAVQLSWERTPDQRFAWPRWEAGTLDLDDSVEIKDVVEQLLADSGNDVVPVLLHTRAIQIKGAPSGSFHSMTVPYWLMIVVIGAVPVFRARSNARRLQRSREGCCVSCGYDLRATPARCPECGNRRKVDGL